MRPSPRRACRRVTSLVLVSAFAGLAFAPAAIASDVGAPSGAVAAPLDTVVTPFVAVHPALSPALIGLTIAQHAARPVPAVDAPLRASAVREASSAAIVRPPSGRSRGLIPLFASYAVLQALDVRSTLQAVNNGGAEQNPLVAPMVSRPPLFIAFKSALTVTTLVAADRLSKRNRVAAYALMFALNSAYTFVVVHNYKVAQGR